MLSVTTKDLVIQYRDAAEAFQNALDRYCGSEECQNLEDIYYVAREALATALLCHPTNKNNSVMYQGNVYIGMETADGIPSIFVVTPTILDDDKE